MIVCVEFTRSETKPGMHVQRYVTVLRWISTYIIFDLDQIGSDRKSFYAHVQAT